MNSSEEITAESLEVFTILDPALGKIKFLQHEDPGLEFRIIGLIDFRDFPDINLIGLCERCILLIII